MSLYLSGFILGGGMTPYGANRWTAGDVSPGKPEPRLRVSVRAV